MPVEADVDIPATIADGWPTADLGRLTPLTVDALVLAYFAASGVRSGASARQALGRYATSEAVDTALRQLIDAQRLESRRALWALSPLGWDAPTAQAIVKSSSDWAGTRRTILPMAALGLPLHPASVRHFRRGENLRAAALTVLYRLPLNPEKTGPSQVRESLLVRSLTACFPGLRFAPVSGAERLDSFSTTVLRGLAQAPTAGRTEVLHHLLARVLGCDDLSLDRVRHAVVTAALRPDPQTADLEPERQAPRRPNPVDAPTGEFARRVQSLVETESTPPFSDRLAIGALHDVYRQTYPTDAGSLATFKARLLDAHRRRWLSLRRLDYIDAIDVDLRQRSEIEADGRQFHFVARVS